MGLSDIFKKTHKTKNVISDETANSQLSDISGGLIFSEQWEFYPCDVDNRPFSIRFDTAIGHLLENVRKQYPHTIELRIPFIEANENGLPTRSEMERVNKIEDDFSCGVHNVRLIGVITGGNCSRFLFCYDGIDEDAENIIQTLMYENQNIEFSFEVFRDDNFDYYDRIIAPSLYDNNWIINRHVCDNLMKNGEVFNEAREIDFFCCFASTQYIQNIADTLCGQGFRELARDQDKGENGEYSLHLALEGIPSLDWINEITNGILDLLKDTDGYFDGWGTTIIKDKEA